MEPGLKELHEKMDTVLVNTALNTQRTEQIETQISELKEQHKAFSEKLDGLATFQNYVKGAWGVAGAFVAWFASHFIKGGGSS